MIAVKRAGTSPEVVALAIYIGSDESAYMAGENIAVDGGLSTLAKCPLELVVHFHEGRRELPIVTLKNAE